jgi:NAD(P)-dependent dehydrogenase (short-subunit alcohol dehydrogenase family)
MFSPGARDRSQSATGVPPDYNAAMSAKVALVTGASSGIGAAIARRLAADGYQVFAAGRDAARLDVVAASGRSIRTWCGDLATPEACARLVADCVRTLGALDLLVNNAGIWQAATAERTSDRHWDDTIATNLSAPFFLSRAAMPHLRARRGAIVNIASNWGLHGGPEAVAYCASKGGLVLMTRAMAMDHAAEGIRVNAVCPGDVATPMLFRGGAERGLDEQAVLRESASATRSGRVTTPEQVAGLVAFLASDDAAQINGEAILMDGGSAAGSAA